MSLPLPAAVLWDMDGTIIDSEHYWMRAERELATQHGTSWNPEQGLALVGLSLYESSQIMKTQMGIRKLSVQEIIDFLTSRVIEQLREELPWRPGARELLLECKSAGIPTALVTMSMRVNALEVAGNLGFAGFDVVVAGDDVTFGKPHPEPFLRAAELLNVDIEDCIAFEDSPTGLASAEASARYWPRKRRKNSS